MPKQQIIVDVDEWTPEVLNTVFAGDKVGFLQMLVRLGMEAAAKEQAKKTQATNEKTED